VLSFGVGGGALDIDGGFSAVTRTMKIVGIEPADYGYSLTLKDYNADLYKYGTLPEYKSNITYIPDGNPKPHVSDKGYVTRDELKRVNEQALKQAALEAAAKAAQAAIDTIARGNTFSDAFQLNGYGTSLENLIDKMDKDARNAKDGLSITKDEILLKVSDTEEGLQAYIGITKKEILAKADDMRRELTALLNIQAGAIHALVKGGGAKGQMSLSVNLPVMIDDKTRDKLIKVSSLEKVNAVYAKVKDTDYYGIKGNAGGTAIKLLWEDARRAALLASQIVLEADQIQFKSDNIFVNGKLKADYINVLELAAKNTFIENLIVQKLRIDSDKSSDQDFEAWFDKTNGLKIKNKGEEIFKVDPAGNAFLKNAFLQNGTFTGNIYSGPLELSPRAPTGVVLEFIANETVFDCVNRLQGVLKESLLGLGSFNGVDITKIIFYGGYMHNFENMSNPDKKVDPFGGLGGWGAFCAIEGGNYTYNFRQAFRRDGRKEFEQNDTIPYAMTFVEHAGSKTFRLKDLPETPPSIDGFVWRDNQGFLRIT